MKQLTPILTHETPENVALNNPASTSSTEVVRFFEQNYNKLYGLIYKMSENAHDTEDILQNTFIKAYTKSNQLKNESSISTWISRIAINEGKRYLKSWRKLPVISITNNLGITEKDFFEQLEFQPDFNDQLIQEEMREKCLRGFLRCLPQNMRVCFLLKTCLELKNSEIAEVMEITESYAKVMLYRARKKLKDMLEYRCSLVDPQKPCKCYLWIKYMKDNGLPIPKQGVEYRSEELKKEYFQKMSLLKKLEFLYRVEGRLSYQEFIKKLKNISPSL
jgi:RNA polymerase sigma-70 factor (ECF subfamily)